MSLHRTRGLALCIALAALLVACGGQTAVQPTAAPATVVPTEAPAPTVAPTEAPTAAAPTEAPAPTVAPTEAPAEAGLLPRALYMLRAGQIVRLEADGTTETQITDEAPFRSDVVAVTDFAVSPADGSLAYVVQREGTPVLVRSGPDGQDAAPLFDSAEVAVSDPLFTPDGQLVAARLTGQPGFQSGLYLIPAAGGEPRLLVPDEGEPDPANPGYGHAPSAFSPDGARLLTNRFGLAVELCDLAVVSLADGAAVPLQVPTPTEGDRATSCETGAWAPDGSAVYFAPVRIGAAPGATGIWRADPATGESFPITPQADGPPFTLYAGPGVAADGTLRAFVAQADTLPIPFEPAPASLAYTMAAIDPAGGMSAELGAAVNEAPVQVLWAPDGSGAVALLFPEVGDPGLFWLPADGGEPALLLGATTDLFAYRWAAP